MSKSHILPLIMHILVITMISFGISLIQLHLKYIISIIVQYFKEGKFSGPDRHPQFVFALNIKYGFEGYM